MKKLLVATAITSTLFLTGCQTMGGTTVKFIESDAPIPKNQTLSGDVGTVYGMRSACNGKNKPFTALPGKVILTPQKNCNNDNSSTFGQRNELRGLPVPSTQKAKYVFESDVSYDIGDDIGNNWSEETIFQVHEGIALGCAPSLAVVLTTSSVIKLKSGYYGGKVGRLSPSDRPGMSSPPTYGFKHCKDDVLTKERVTTQKEFFDADRARDTGKNYIKKDGTVARFRVEIDFPGDSSFKATVFINGENVTSGYYNPPVWDSRFKTPAKYMLKFGNYSNKKIDYTMIWENPRLLKVE